MKQEESPELGDVELPLAGWRQFFCLEFTVESEDSRKAEALMLGYEVHLQSHGGCVYYYM